MNVNCNVRRRQLGLSTRIEIDFAMDRIKLKEVLQLSSGVSPNDEDAALKTYGPLACTKLNTNIIAIANEDGYINLMKTNKLENTAHWLAHENAIFDIKACPDGRTLMTASGDTTIRRWDVETKKEIFTISPHHSSIKSISIYDNNTVASGSRDGTIQVHDLRLKSPTIIVIQDAHRNQIIAKPRKVSAKTDPVSCVTNVAFDPHYPQIYSTGANDATIKLWDLRRQVKVNRPRRTMDGKLIFHQPYVEVHHPKRGIHCGYSHLLLSSSKVYAACSDNKIYCYDNFVPTAEPVRFTGFHYDTYLKLAIVDDRFLLSGSKGGGAIVWSLGKNKSSSRYFPETTKQPFGQLQADKNDRFDTSVIETDWESLSVFTFRDDRLACKWTMQHVSESERRSLANEPALASQGNDVSIEMSDIIDINVLRPNQNAVNTQAGATL